MPDSRVNADLSLGEKFLRTVWIFQGIAALPIFLILGFLTIMNMFNTWQRLYDFITHFMCTLLSAAILFIVVLQRYNQDTLKSRLLTLRFEVAKVLLASILWLWLLLDACFGPSDHYSYWHSRTDRIVVAAISVILLLLLFYPTVFYSIQKLREERKGRAPSIDEEQGERAPLIPGQDA